ncbi:hypothetical protein P879_05321 [Paragonimus westermani]|uniref:DUF4817 domain-containing protein n=1 Tax=Paragonimus westermani TaxID=34504 RepID=A0A8T0DKG8_9TREM|nr:hypothetical protein P879_05321 [Paragonimus westermani]
MTQIDVSPLATEQRIELVYLYAESNRNAAETARRFNVRHLGVRQVSPQSVRELIKKFEKCGSTQTRPRSGRPRTATNEVCARRIMERVRASPFKSTRRLARECGTSQIAVYRVLKEYNIRQCVERQLQELKEQELNCLDFHRSVVQTAAV